MRLLLSSSFILLVTACGTSEIPAPAEGEPVHTVATPEQAKDMPEHHAPEAPADGAVFACPMHPDMVSDAPGQCSKCGMALVQTGSHDHEDASADDGHTDHDH